jgi:predicted 2-oxoglutarate/Fe(II)-dependent dioxygenase YbiX
MATSADRSRAGVPVSGSKALAGRFLPRGLCDVFVRELEREGWWQWSEIDNDEGSRVDLDFRRSQWREVPRSCEALVASRLLAIAPGLARHFGRLHGFEGPNVLRYRSGAFFRPHQDERYPASTTPFRRRRITLAVALNDVGFDGGVLRLHGLDPVGPIDVSPTAGRFVAFPADTIHEVSPIYGGDRYTLVAWMY